MKYKLNVTLNIDAETKNIDELKKKLHSNIASACVSLYDVKNYTYNVSCERKYTNEEVIAYNEALEDLFYELESYIDDLDLEDCRNVKKSLELEVKKG